MSASAEEKEVLDLRKMEDIFACMEAVAMATAMLSSVDPHSADELNKVIQALGALSVLVDQGDLVQVVEKRVEVAGPAGQGGAAQPAMPLTMGGRGIDDLVEFIRHPQSTPSALAPAESEDTIYDLLTGEKLR